MRIQQKYYNDSRWKYIREEALRDNPICTCCNREWATCVHHIIPFAQYIKSDPAKAEKLCFNGEVAALCDTCHKEIHKLINLDPQEVEMILELAPETVKIPAVKWHLAHS